MFGYFYPKNSRNVQYTDNVRRGKLELLQRNGPEGIHDVHMNQGNNKGRSSWLTDNGDQDGALFMHFEEENKG
ncbi:hypothetical protein C6360_28645 [Bacillus wiedmannii]|nr:hypothetical protein C6360_28645 [Bacillus wiedmannii]